MSRSLPKSWKRTIELKVEEEIKSAISVVGFQNSNSHLRNENGMILRQIKHIHIQHAVAETMMTLRMIFILPFSLSTILATVMEVTQLPTMDRIPKRKKQIILENNSPARS